MVDLLRTTRQAFLVKEEATIGTDPTPTGTANAMLLNAPLVPTFARNLTPVRGVNGTLHGDFPIIGPPLANFTVTFDLKGSGTNNVAPDWAELMKGAGMIVTPGASDVDITFTSDPKSLTIYHYLDGLLTKYHACYVNPTFTFTSGARWTCSAAIQGRFGGITDAAVPTITLDATTAPTWINKSTLVNSVETHMQQFTLNFGGTIATYDTPVTDFNGVLTSLLTALDLSAQMNPNFELVATTDWETLLSGETDFPVVLEVGTAAGNIVQFNAPEARIVNQSPVDDNGLVRNQIDLAFQGLNSAFSFITS